MLRDRTLIARSALELLTSVAGVLIALAVNDWSANRSNRSLEREYLERLQVELRSDSSLTYATLFPRLKTKAAALDTVQQTVLVGKPIADTLAFMRAVLSHLVCLMKLREQRTS